MSLLSAPNAERGLDIARAERPDVIILDINLPGMDGFAALQRLKAMPETKATPVLAPSATVLPDDIDRGLRAGFREYLGKPVDVGRLLASIAAALRSKVD